jgi:hypothetical protein
MNNNNKSPVADDKEKKKEEEAIFLGFANLVTAITVEDFAWFVNRWLVPLKDDPKGEQLMQFSECNNEELVQLKIRMIKVV